MMMMSTKRLRQAGHFLGRSRRARDRQFSPFMVAVHADGQLRSATKIRLLVHNCSPHGHYKWSFWRSLAGRANGWMGGWIASRLDSWPTWRALAYFPLHARTGVRTRTHVSTKPVRQWSRLRAGQQSCPIFAGLLLDTRVQTHTRARPRKIYQ